MLGRGLHQHALGQNSPQHLFLICRPLFRVGAKTIKFAIEEVRLDVALLLPVVAVAVSQQSGRYDPSLEDDESRGWHGTHRARGARAAQGTLRSGNAPLEEPCRSGNARLGQHALRQHAAQATRGSGSTRSGNVSPAHARRSASNEPAVANEVEAAIPQVAFDEHVGVQVPEGHLP